MGGPIPWGVGAAVTWGFADFTARFAGRAIGVPATMLGIMLAGTLITALYIGIAGEPLTWDPPGLWTLIISGLCTAVATALLFQAIATGPVSLGSPTASSYPAFALPFSMIFGARPEPVHWVAMVVTLAGVWVVALAVGRADRAHQAEYTREVVVRSLVMAAGAAFFFAVSMVIADVAIERYGPWQMVLAVRLTGVCFFAGWFLAVRKRPGIPTRAWPLLIALALFDTAGYATLFIGLGQENGTLALVASSSYAVVAVLLAWVFLREAVGKLLWLGVLLVVGGISVLSWFG